MKDLGRIRGDDLLELIGGNMCFACGKENSIGLKLDFAWEGECYTTRFTPSAEHQSYNGILHGGLMSTILDELMGRMFFIRGEQVMTAQLEVRFRQAVHIGQEIYCAAEIVEDKGRVIEVKSTAYLQDGTMAAQAQGKFMRIRKGRKS